MNSAEVKRSLFPLLVVNFISSFGFSLVMPFLVFLVNGWGGNAVVYGIIGASFSLFQLIGGPVLGSLSDRYGRRKILFVCQAGTVLAWLIFLIAFALPVTVVFQTAAFTLTLPILIIFLSRAIDGITGANISVANAYLADITDEPSRKANFGKMAGSQNLGFIAGPLVAGVLGSTSLGIRLPVWAAIGISVAGLLVIAFRLPESRPELTKKTIPPDAGAHKVLGQEIKDCIADSGNKSFGQLIQLPNVPLMLLLYFLIFLGFSIFYTAFPIEAVKILHWNTTTLGIFFSVLSGTLVLVQGPVLSYLSTRFSDRALVITGNVILACCFVLLAFGNTILAFVAALFFAVGNGIMWPSYLAALSKIAGDKTQGAVQGLAGSAGSLASIIGLIGGGFLYGLLGPQAFIVSAGIILFIAVVAVKLPAGK